jgi:hypothetical protein
MGVKNHTLGDVRYFTYYLIFPGDNDFWVDQYPFCGPLDTMLRLTTFYKKPGVPEALMKKGEAHWKDHNGVTHRVVVENFERPRKWGVKRA